MQRTSFRMQFFENEISSNRLFLLFLIGLGMGILTANTAMREPIIDSGLFGDFFLIQTGSVNHEHGRLFLYVLEKRIKQFGILLLLFLSKNAKVAVCLFGIGLGMGLGIMLSAAAMQQGIKGIIICVAGLLPHYLLYLPVLAVIMETAQTANMTEGFARKKTWVKKGIGRRSIMWALGFLVVFIGVYLESFLNPIIMKIIIKIFIDF